MSPERRENSHDRAKVVEQLRTPWGPLNKRTSQDVLAAIGRETGLFQVPRIIFCDEAIKLINETRKQALKGKQVMGAWELQYPLMRSYLHNPIADNLLCGFLPTYELDTKDLDIEDDDYRYCKLCGELIKQQVDARVYMEQMGFPVEGLDKFGVFFQEQIGGRETEKVSVLDTTDGAYVEIVPYLRQRKKRGFLFEKDELRCSMCVERTDEFVETDLANIAREIYFRHLITRERFYRDKSNMVRFPLVSEWVHRSASDKDEFYAVQLRASLVKRPYVFNVIKVGNGELVDKWEQTVRIHFNWPTDTINDILSEAQGYSFYVLGTSNAQFPFGVRYGQPAEVLINHEKAATLMDHNLFSIVQVVHSLGGRITIVDLGRGGVKYYDQRA